MNDMRPTITPRSDQINADDLLAGPITITITKVSIKPGSEQPVEISYENDRGKPFRPCKSMCRVMVHCWGADANKYTGRSMTLYCDPKVTWGGMAVGGIRISAMTDIPEAQVMALTMTKGNKKPFTVKPLVVEKPAPRRTWNDFLNDLETELASAQTAEEVAAIRGREIVRRALADLKNGALKKLETMLEDAFTRTSEDPPLMDGEEEGVVDV